MKIYALILFCMIVGISYAIELPVMSVSDYDVLHSFDYRNSREARKVWAPLAGSRPVSVVKAGGRNVLEMKCNFKGTTIKRVSWDANIKLDLSLSQGLKFHFFCANSFPVAQFNVYLRSGNGWYAASFAGDCSGKWTVVSIDKAEMSTEGKTAGWKKIDRIRISAWRANDNDSVFAVADLGLFGGNARIAVIRADSVQHLRPADAVNVTRYTKNVTSYLRSMDISYNIVSDLDIKPLALSGNRIAIMPYNPDMPKNVVIEIRRFLNNGGGLVCFYLLPPKLMDVVGISVGKHLDQKYKGQFAEMRFTTGTLLGMPAVVTQKSWNVFRVRPIQGRSNAVASWYDEEGRNIGEPAVVMSDNCIFVSTVFLSGDPQNKKKMMLAMMGRFMPELWRDAATKAIARIGQFGEYKNAAELKGAVLAVRGQNKELIEMMSNADSLKVDAECFVVKGGYIQAVGCAEAANDTLIRAYCSVQESQKNEYRGFWCHSPFGVSGMSWDQAIERLADNGFTAIMPNMLWSGAAYYNSKVLVVAPEVATQGDQLALCVAACKKYDVECHVWKVCWNMGSRDLYGFAAKMKKAGRTQVSSSGKSLDNWLCPSHPANRKLEVDSALEVVAGYGVTGIHLDYVRYPGENYCFCDGCRGRFESIIGHKIKNWPSDVRDGALNTKWRAFRRKNITSLVAEISDRARQIKPGIKISVAVFSNWTSARNDIAQDWKLWCERRYIDFVCPMDYRASKLWFANTVAQQKEWAGEIPCYPGIGLSTWTTGDSISLLLDQIKITRRLGTKGFAVFKYGASEARDIVPLCGLGITGKDFKP